MFYFYMFFHHISKVIRILDFIFPVGKDFWIRFFSFRRVLNKNLTTGKKLQLMIMDAVCWNSLTFSVFALFLMIFILFNYKVFLKYYVSLPYSSLFKGNVKKYASRGKQNRGLLVEKSYFPKKIFELKSLFHSRKGCWRHF